MEQLGLQLPLCHTEAWSNRCNSAVLYSVISFVAELQLHHTVTVFYYVYTQLLPTYLTCWTPVLSVSSFPFFRGRLPLAQLWNWTVQLLSFLTFRPFSMFSIWSIKSCSWMNSRELQLLHWSACSNSWQGSKITQVRRCNLLHWTKENPACDEILGTGHPEIKIQITLILWIHLDYLVVCCLYMSQNWQKPQCAPNLCGKEYNF